MPSGTTYWPSNKSKSRSSTPMYLIFSLKFFMTIPFLGKYTKAGLRLVKLAEKFAIFHNLNLCNFCTRWIIFHSLTPTCIKRRGFSLGWSRSAGIDDITRWRGYDCTGGRWFIKATEKRFILLFNVFNTKYKKTRRILNFDDCLWANFWRESDFGGEIRVFSPFSPPLL